MVSKLISSLNDISSDLLSMTPFEALVRGILLHEKCILFLYFPLHTLRGSI